MKKVLKISHYLKYAAALLFFAGMLWIGLYGTNVFATHTEQFKASGFAYGGIDDNNNGSAETGLGYVSFGCETNPGNSCDDTATTNFPTGYGVRINTNPDSDDYGKFFGYAWSSNYGWISFYHDDVSSCGSEGGIEITDIDNFIHTPGEAQLLDGYARVLNYDIPEWDGCIDFSDGGINYGVKAVSVDSGNIELTGWAWGGNIVGWMRLDCPYCNVQFEAVDIGEEECEEADDPEVCTDPEDLNSGLALYVGGQSDPILQVIGNSSYTLGVTDIGQPQNVKLIPQAFDQDVDTCTATSSSSMGASVSDDWDGPIPSLNPLSPDMPSYQFITTITNYNIGEVITFNLNCLTVLGDIPLSAQAFVTVQYPTSSVSIDANPNPIDTVLDPAGTTTLSWGFDNVQDNSCEINGVVDFTPSDGTDGLTAMTSAFADDIGFNSWSPDNPGTDALFGIVNFPVGFTITCLDYADQPLSDSVYITTTELGCTESMEAAGWCSNDINPIFEEF